MDKLIKVKCNCNWNNLEYDPNKNFSNYYNINETYKLILKNLQFIVKYQSKIIINYAEKGEAIPSGYIEKHFWRSTNTVFLKQVLTEIYELDNIDFIDLHFIKQIKL